MFAKFQNLQEFDAWHEAIKIQLGLPNNEGTIDYTMPRLKKDGSLVAFVDEQIDISGLEIISEEQAIIQGYLPTLDGYME